MLSPNSVDKLVYIYMNSHILQEINAGVNHYIKGDIEAELLALKNYEIEKTYFMQGLLGKAIKESLPATLSSQLIGKRPYFDA